MGGGDQPTMTFEPPERLNIANHFLDARVREGLGDRPALRLEAGVESPLLRGGELFCLKHGAEGRVG